MSNTYQKDRRRAQPDATRGEVAVPEQVIVSMAEIAESAKEGLLALAGCGERLLDPLQGSALTPARARAPKQHLVKRDGPIPVPSLFRLTLISTAKRREPTHSEIAAQRHDRR